jgi:hypothetical protein
MKILTDFGRPYTIGSLTTPLAVKYNWVFNGPACDFMLQQITYLEETTGPAIKLQINGTDRETYQLDTVPVKSCSGVKHIAFGFSPDEMKLRTLDINVIDFADEMSIVHPMVSKGTALVSPVGQAAKNINQQIETCVAIGPFDLVKHLATKVVGDIFS